MTAIYLIWRFVFKKNEGDICKPSSDKEVLYANSYVLNSKLECVVSNCEVNYAVIKSDNKCIEIGSLCDESNVGYKHTIYDDGNCKLEGCANGYHENDNNVCVEIFSNSNELSKDSEEFLDTLPESKYDLHAEEKVFLGKEKVFLNHL